MVAMYAADLALYQAKAAGKGCSVQFLPAFPEAEQQRRCFERELEVAVRQHQFVLFYQPQFDAVSHALTGCEALLRCSRTSCGDSGNRACASASICFPASWMISGWTNCCGSLPTATPVLLTWRWMSQC